MDGIIEKDFLAVITMKGHTRGCDFMEVLKEFVEKHRIPVKKLISVCTDGCPSMVGATNGLIALMKEEWNLPDLLPIHCLLHQETLSCKISNNKLKDVMNTIVSIIHFIRARELNHRKFKDLEELQANYGDVILHTAIRWLSKGKVLERFFHLKHEIILFFQQSGKEFPQLQQNEWWALAAFLTDITMKFNNLNLEMQGPNKIIGQMTNKVFAFKDILQLYINELEAGDFSNFPTVAALQSKVFIPDSTISQDMISYSKEYLLEIQNRLDDVRKIKNCFILVENPWHVENEDMELFCQFGFSKTQLMNEIIELKHDTQLKDNFVKHREYQEYIEFLKNAL
nr:zinc finger BED domain-containing protein 5-like [Leptinotarsa decemlineata]